MDAYFFLPGSLGMCPAHTLACTWPGDLAPDVHKSMPDPLASLNPNRCVNSTHTCPWAGSLPCSLIRRAVKYIFSSVLSCFLPHWRTPIYGQTYRWLEEQGLSVFMRNRQVPTVRLRVVSWSMRLPVRLQLSAETKIAGTSSNWKRQTRLALRHTPETKMEEEL